MKSELITRPYDARDALAKEYILSLHPALYLPLWKRDGASFISDDAHGHLCTATGTTWGTQGRTLVGAASDNIAIGGIGDLILSMGTKDHTLIFWAKMAYAAGTKGFIYCGAGGAGLNQDGYLISTTTGLNIRISFSDGTAERLTGDFTVSDIATNILRMYCIRFDRDGNITVSENTIPCSETLAINAQAGNVVNTVAFGIPGGLYNDAVHGDIIAVHRLLLPSEEAQIHHFTKWRYS